MKTAGWTFAGYRLKVTLPHRTSRKRAFPVLSDQELRRVHKTRPERHVTEDGMGMIDALGDSAEVPGSLDDLFDGLDEVFNDFDLD